MTTQSNTKSSPSHRSSAGRWLIRIAIGIITIIILLIVLTPVLVNSIVRPKVVDALREQLNGEPRLDSLSFSWFGGLTVQGLHIGNPTGFTAGDAVAVERVTADPSLTALVAGNLVLNKDLRVENIRLNVEQNSKGELNLAKLPKSQPHPPSQKQTQEKRPASTHEKQPVEQHPTKLPEVRGGIVIAGVVISIKTPTLPQPVLLSPLSSETRVDTFDKPVMFTLKNADNSLTINGQALIARNGILDIPNIAAQLDYSIAPALIAPLKPMLAASKLEGSLSGRGVLSLTGLGKPSGKGDLKLDVASVDVTSSSGGSNAVRTIRPGLVAFAYEFKPAEAGKTDADARLTSPVANFNLSGTATQAGANPSFEGSASLAVELAEMAARFPGMLGTNSLRGRIEGALKNIKASSDFVTVNLDLKGEAAVGNAATTHLALAGQANAYLKAGKYELSELNATLDKTTAKANVNLTMPPNSPAGNATLKAVLHADGDLGQIFTLAKSWNISTYGYDGTGTAMIHIEADGPLNKLVVNKTSLALNNASLSGSPSFQQVRWPTSFTISDATMQIDALNPTGTPVQITSGHAVGLGFDLTTIRGILPLDTKSTATDLTFEGTCNPTTVAATLTAVPKDLSIQSGPGPVSLKLKGSLVGAGTDVALKLDLPETSVTKAGQQPIQLGKPALELDTRLDKNASIYRITKATLKTLLASLDAQADVAMDPQGNFTKLEAHTTGNAELPKLRDLAIALGTLKPDTELSGTIKLAGDIKGGQGGAFPCNVSLEAPSLHFKGPQTKGVAIDEPNPVIKLAGTFTNTKPGFTFNFSEGSSIEMQMMRGTLKGGIRKAPDQPMIADNIAANLTYDPVKLKPLLTALNAGEILATQPQTAEVRFNGPLQPGTDTAAWVKNFSFGSGLGYTGYKYSGVTVEGAPISLSLASGRLPLDYTCKINGGNASARGNIDLGGEKSTLALGLDKMGINYEMSQWLKFLNPLFNVGTGTLEGQVNAQFDGNWTGAIMESSKPGAKTMSYSDLLAQRLNARGKFSVANLKISGSPLMNILSNALGVDSSAGIGEVQPTDYTIQNGKLSYEKMVVRLSGIEMTFSGEINFDTTMKMQIFMPFPKKYLKGDSTLAKYVSTVSVPLTGTLSSPRLDFNAVVQNALKGAAAQAVKEKAGEAIGGKAQDLLKGFLGGDKK